MSSDVCETINAVDRGVSIRSVIIDSVCLPAINHQRLFYSGFPFQSIADLPFRETPEYRTCTMEKEDGIKRIQTESLKRSMDIVL